MLCPMYVLSRSRSWGTTWNRCTAAGISVPTTSDTTSHPPSATAGRSHPRRQMLITRRTAAATEIKASRLRAGSLEVTSV